MLNSTGREPPVLHMIASTGKNRKAEKSMESRNGYEVKYKWNNIYISSNRNMQRKMTHDMRIK